MVKILYLLKCLDSQFLGFATSQNKMIWFVKYLLESCTNTITIVEKVNLSPGDYDCFMIQSPCQTVALFKMSYSNKFTTKLIPTGFPVKLDITEDVVIDIISISVDYD